MKMKEKMDEEDEISCFLISNFDVYLFFNFIPLYFFVFCFGPCNIVRDHLSQHISVFCHVSCR